MANVAEGFECASPGDFHRFVVIAEVRAQLCVAPDIGYLSAKEFEQLDVQAEELSRILGRLHVLLEKRLNR